MMNSFVRAAAAAAAAALIAAVPVADAAAQSLPQARELVARHVDAVGGRAAIEARRSIRARGTFEMPAMGVNGEFEAAQTRVGAMRMKVTLPGLGEMESGYDGTTAWSINPMIGPRILDGPEVAQTRDEANMLAVFREAPAVSSIETVEVTSMDGQRCYKVRVTWASGRRSFDCYSVETGLLIGTENTQQSAMGAVDVAMILGDYRDFGGVKMATTLRSRMAGQEQIVRLSTVEFDTVDDAAMAVPPQIAALRAPRE